MTGVGTTIAGALSQIAAGMRRMKKLLPADDESFQVPGVSCSLHLLIASGQSTGSSRRVAGLNRRSTARSG